MRGNLSIDEILEMAKKETDYDKKMWLQDTAQGQWRSYIETWFCISVVKSEIKQEIIC